jgi:predicted KAP-like P-loop ATPase
LIIFVDELDRCKPSFAVKLLEQIKHYFLLQNVTFVFSTNILELSKTISKFYGNDFQGDKYLNRFFDLFFNTYAY